MIYTGKVFLGDETGLYPWWSFGKTILATGALMAVQEGLLELDKSYGEIRGTLRQLLRHEAGYGEYAGLKAYQDRVAAGMPPWSGGEMLTHAHGRKPIFEPGTGWAYSNIGYYHVRYLLETVYGMSIDAVLSERLFRPLGLKDTFVAMDAFDLSGVQHVKPGYDPKFVYHGLVVGSLKDAAKCLYEIAFGALLTAPIKREMRTLYTLNFELPDRPWRSPAYGLGGMADDNPKAFSFGHTGQGPDSVIAVYAFPDEGGSVAAAISLPTQNQGVVEQAVVDSVSDFRDNS